MLQAIRDKAGSVFVKLLFGALILSFGVWGIGDIFRDNGNTDAVVAKVGDQDIRVDALQNAMQPALERLRQQFGSTLDMQQAKQLGIVDTVLQQLVDRSLIDQEAAELRLDVSNAVVRTAVFDNPDFRGTDGRFDRQRFNQLLAANRLSEDQYVAMVRRDLPRVDLVGSLTAGAVAPQPLIDALHHYRNEKRIADVVAFPLTTAASPGQPSTDALTKFYDAHKDMFQAPEYRGFTLASLTPADLIKQIDIPDAKLKQEFDQRQDEFQQPEQREVQQILSPSEAVAKQAEAALAQGKDWKEVATTIAKQDPGTIDLGLMQRKQMPKLLADIAFTLPLDKASAPVKSPLGWHILRVTKIEPGKTVTFQQAKPKLKEALAKDDAVDQLYKIANQVDDAIAGGTSLADAIAKFHLNKTVVAATDTGGDDPAGKPVALPVSATEVLKLAFATPAGETTRVTETQDGGIFVLHSDKVTPPQTRPLADVKDKAIAAWQDAQKHDSTAKAAEALAAAAKPPALLSGVARQKGLNVTTSPPLSRTPDASDAGVPPALIAKLFAAQPGAVFTITDPAGAYVAQLRKIDAAPPASKAESAALQHEIDTAMQGDIGDEFTEALRQRYPVKIDHAVLDPLF